MGARDQQFEGWMRATTKRNEALERGDKATAAAEFRKTKKIVGDVSRRRGAPGRGKR